MFKATRLVASISSKSSTLSLSRNIAASSVLMQRASDPIQQLFLDKSKEYFQKKAASKTGLIDSSPQTQKAVQDEVDRINKQYGSSATSEFPSFSFEEPKLDSIAAEAK